MIGKNKLNKESVVPYYYQIETIIRNRIMNNEFKREDLLPSENELSKEYNVTRNTIRKALQRLVYEGLLISKKGKGYFIAETKLEQMLFRFYAFAKDFSKDENCVNSKVIKKEVISSTEYIAKKLDVSINNKIHKIVRVRFFNNKPMIYETSYISLGKFDFNDFKNTDLTHGCIYDILSNVYNIEIANGEEFLEPIILNEYEAKILSVRKNSPAFLIESIVYTITQKPIELRRSIIRGDRLRFKIGFNFKKTT